MIIDMHAHVAYEKLFPEYFKKGIIKNIKNVFASDCKNKKIPEKLIENIVLNMLDDYSCRKLIQQMDCSGISLTVLLIADLGYGRHDIDLSIDEIYAFYNKILLDNPDKFVVFGGIDPRRGRDGLDLLEQGIKKYNFKGLKLYPPCGFELNDKNLFPFYELCSFYNVPVLTHTGPSLDSMQKEKNFPQSIIEISEEFKDVIFILGHGAVICSDITASIAQKHDNVYLELSGFQSELKNKEYFNNKLSWLVNILQEKVVFGTDWPMFNMGGNHASWVDYLMNKSNISISALEYIFEKNAKRILKLN